MVLIDGSIFIRTTSCFRLGGGGGGCVNNQAGGEVLETVCEVREVERCEEMLEEECSLVEEVVLECREVETGKAGEAGVQGSRSAAVWRGSSAGWG